MLLYYLAVSIVVQLILQAVPYQQINLDLDFLTLLLVEIPQS